VHGRAYQSYQVCLICGVVYAYDCATMRRTERLVAPVEGVKQANAANELSGG